MKYKHIVLDKETSEHVEKWGSQWMNPNIYVLTREEGNIVNDYAKAYVRVIDFNFTNYPIEKEVIEISPDEQKIRYRCSPIKSERQTFNFKSRMHGVLERNAFSYIIKYDELTMKMLIPVLNHILECSRSNLASYDWSNNVTNYIIEPVHYTINVISLNEAILIALSEKKDFTKDIVYMDVKYNKFIIPLFKNQVLKNLIEIDLQYEIEGFIEMKDFFSLPDVDLRTHNLLDSVFKVN